ncbi:MAG: hypothetical protein WDW38_000584 [Sanguina aurantia]
MSKTVFMRGLQMFISDIRACQNKEAEQRRVDKELAKIRAKFGDDKSLSGYDRRKYVWKLLYIYMLGYDIEFGHKQACDLIPLGKYSDKQVGYMACSLLLHENDEFLRLSINAIHLDLTSRNEAFQCLALSFVGNVGGQEMAEALTQDVIKLLTSGATRPLIKKRAALCLLRMLRKTLADAQLLGPETFASTLNSLLEEANMGLLLSSVTLLWGICVRNGSAGYESCQGRVIKIFERLQGNKERDIPPEYLYYGIPSPWLQTKVLRVLQFYGPPSSVQDRTLLGELLQTLINTASSDSLKANLNPNKGNAIHAILFEAIALALHLDDNTELLTNCVSILGRFLSTKEPNIKYLALETLARLALVPEILAAIRHHQATVIGSLKDPDVSIRKRAMDLLFTMCDSSVADEVVSELLKYLTIADLSFREELVLKIAILAEKFAPTVQWYVDVAMQMLERAGDFVSQDIWQRVVQLVTNNEGMQEYAAKNVADVLARGVAHESLVCTAAYLLGEYGRLIQSEKPPMELYRLLYAVFPGASQATKGLLMTAFIKLYLMEPDNAALRKEVLGLFEKHKKLMDSDLQQRATEYLALASNPASAGKFILPMPKWVERESSLLRQLQRTEGGDGEDGGGHSAPAAADAAEAQAAVPAHAPPPATEAFSAQSAPSMPDMLFGGDATPRGAPPPPSSDPFSSLALAHSGPAPRLTPVDLLGDMFADVVSVSAAQPPPQQQPQQQPHPSLPATSTAPPHAPATSNGSQNQTPYNGVAAQPPPAAAAAAAHPAAPRHAQTAAQAPVAAAAVASYSFADDPFGDSSFGPPPPAPAPALPAYDPAVPTGDVRGWHSALLLKDRGVLYEDQYLQVGLQARYASGRGDLMLFLGNKAPDSVTGVSITVAPTPALQVQVGPPPSALAPKQQTQVPIQVGALQPFSEAPAMTLSYTLGSTVMTQQLQLPVLSHKFLVPEPAIAKELFFETWKQYRCEPLQDLPTMMTPPPFE